MLPLSCHSSEYLRYTLNLHADVASVSSLFNIPTGHLPDGLSADAVLPSVAPDPEDFTGPGTNQLQFSCFTGDPEGPGGSSFYRISTAGVTNASLEPLPASVLLLASVVTTLPLLGRRR